ncbi:MAG: hypothetical protein AAGD06_12565 [Acidobacteriota bacterium]
MSLRRRCPFPTSLLVAALGAVLPVFAVPGVGQPPELLLVDLGVPGPESSARALDSAGQVAANSFDVPFSLQGYVWLPSAAGGLPQGANGLGTPGGEPGRLAVRDIARQEGGSPRLVGTFNPDDGDPRGFTWRDGTFTFLPFPDMVTEGVPLAVNASGMATGYDLYFVFCFPGLWLPGDAPGSPPTYRRLPGIGNLQEGTGNDINDAGQVVGQIFNACDLPGDPSSAYLWLPEPAFGLEAGPHDLTPGQPGDAQGISNGGVVVGSFRNAGTTSAFRWQEGELTQLPSLPGESRTVAYGVNDRGWIVGETGSLGSQAVLWKDGQVHAIDGLLALDDGWSITSAFDVNNSGEIAATGVRGGLRHAVLLRSVTIFGDGFESGSLSSWSRTGP